MGTRADFYVGRGPQAEWLGSIAWDGYPGGIDDTILKATTEVAYRESVAKFFNGREDATLPAQGWPWPWSDSNTTDYAYAFDSSGVWYSVGHQTPRWWKAADGDEPDEEDDDYKKLIGELQVCDFPDMSARKNITFGKRSGTITLVPTAHGIRIVE